MILSSGMLLWRKDRLFCESGQRGWGSTYLYISCPQIELLLRLSIRKKRIEGKREWDREDPLPQPGL